MSFIRVNYYLDVATEIYKNINLSIQNNYFSSTDSPFLSDVYLKVQPNMDNKQ